MNDHTLRKISSIKLPQRGREAENEEYNHEHEGVVECSNCHNVHFKKRWYASISELKNSLKKKEIPISENKTCPACKMSIEHLFEGELFVEEFPLQHKSELLKLINNFGKQAIETDPQHRIIKIEETEKGYRITTTENQLADRLAKKIKDAFHSVEVHFSHSKEPFEVDRVHALFQEK